MISIPPKVIFPPVVSYNLGIKLIMEDLPAPLGPTIAKHLPAGRLKLTSFKRGAPSS